MTPVVEQFSSGAALLGGSFMDALPDPMKLDLYEVGFVMILLTAMYLFLKFAFFKPVIRVVDAREAAMAAGAALKGEAATQVEQRQADYAAHLKELRAKAFEHRKALAEAAAQERQAILDRARGEATESRGAALASLQAQRESAKGQLLAEVDKLSASMVDRILQQA